MKSKHFGKIYHLVSKSKFCFYAKSGVLSSDSSLIVEFEACVTMTVGFVWFSLRPLLTPTVTGNNNIAAKIPMKLAN